MLRKLIEMIAVHAPRQVQGRRRRQENIYDAFEGISPSPVGSWNDREKQRDGINHHAASLETKKVGYAIPAILRSGIMRSRGRAAGTVTI